jgi:dTDP-4-dehydrorhamnose reductase
MKVLILGKNSQVGKSFVKQRNFIFLSKKQADISKFTKLKKMINAISPDIIINLAAYNDVQNSEIEFKTAHKVNCVSIKNLLKIIENKKIFLIHVSTDYVFSGKKNINKKWKVNSLRNPLNKYGLSKKLGEDLILKSKNTKTLIVRTSWVFSKYNENFVKKILNIAKVNKKIDVVSDQFGAPTSAYSLAKFLIHLTKNLSLLKGTKVMHFCNKPYCSWFYFAKVILKHKKYKIKVNPVLTKNSVKKVIRPKNTKLDYTFTKNKLSYEQENWEKYLKGIYV